MQPPMALASWPEGFPVQASRGRPCHFRSGATLADFLVTARVDYDFSHEVLCIVPRADGVSFQENTSKAYRDAIRGHEAQNLDVIAGVEEHAAGVSHGTSTGTGVVS